MNQLAGASVCIIAHNEESRIGPCLRSITGLMPPRVPFEIVVVDNGSMDGTGRAARLILEASGVADFRLERLEKRELGAARAHAVRIARHPYVAFIDADCAAPEGWLDSLASALSREQALNPNVCAAGSGNLPPPASTHAFDRALSLMLSSPIGGFNTVQARPRGRSSAIAHLPTCNVIYERDKILAVGNFSDDFDRVCEDLELSLRLRANGYFLHYETGLDVAHHHKPKLSAWAEKMFRYGWGQMKAASVHPAHLVGVKSLPWVGAFAFLAVAVARPGLAAALLIAYLAAIAALSFGLALARARNPRLAPLLAALFVTTHACYALGELAGLPWLFRPGTRESEEAGTLP